MEPVPTVEDLFAMKLATPVAFNAKGLPTHWTIRPAGQDLINEATARNAEEFKRLGLRANPGAAGGYLLPDGTPYENLATE